MPLSMIASCIVFSASAVSCKADGRNVTVINDDIYIGCVDSDSDRCPDRKAVDPGKMVDHNFKVSSDFKTIETKGFVNVVFTQSDNASDFEVRGRLPEKVLEKMIVEVSNGKLRIDMKPCRFKKVKVDGEVPTIYITNKKLNAVVATGSGDFVVNGTLNASRGLNVCTSGSGDFKFGTVKAPGQNVDLTISGSGDIDIARVESKSLETCISGSGDIDCDMVNTANCSITISGSGEVSISGTTDYVDMSVAGSGEIDAANLIAKKGRATIAGSGDIVCNVEDLSIAVAGSGNIRNKK